MMKIRQRNSRHTPQNKAKRAGLASREEPKYTPPITSISVIKVRINSKVRRNPLFIGVRLSELRTLILPAMKAFVELPLQLVVVSLSLLLLGCAENEETGDNQVFGELVGVTKVASEKVRGYPSAYGVVLLRLEDGSRIAIALPAIQDRKMLASYQQLQKGGKIKVGLAPWAERPALVNSSYLANDFGDEFDLQLFVGSL